MGQFERYHKMQRALSPNTGRLTKRHRLFSAVEGFLRICVSLIVECSPSSRALLSLHRVRVDAHCLESIAPQL